MCITAFNPSEPCCRVSSTDVDPHQITWTRMISLVGAIDTDPALPSYDRDWVLRSSPFSEVFLAADLNATDRDTWYEIYNDAPPYEIRMKPVRWRLGSNRAFDEDYGSSVGGGHFAERRFFSLLNSFVTGSDKTPHVSEHYGSLGRTLSLMPPFYESSMTDNGSKVTHARVLVNGVDLTGVIPVVHPGLVSVGGQPGRGVTEGDGRFCNVITLKLPVDIPHGATVEFDFFYLLSLSRFEVERNVAIAIDEPFALAAWDGSVCESSVSFRSHTVTGTTALRRPGADEGNFVLVCEDGDIAGSTTFRTGARHWLKTGGTWVFDHAPSWNRLTLFYKTEQPFLLLRKPVAQFFFPDNPTFVTAKYAQVGDRYPACSLAGSFSLTPPPEVSVGGFAPRESSEFRLLGFFGGSLGLGHATPGDIATNPNFSQFPTSITVRRPGVPLAE
jgi:hypothetical protein